MIEYLYGLAILFGINAILAVSLNVINGYCGLFSLGHAGFFAIGAYTSAASTVYWFPELAQSSPTLALLAACVIGTLAAAVAGFAVGLPCLRLGGDYLAVATVGFGEIIRIVIMNMDAVGAARGFPGIPGLTKLWHVIVLVVLTLWMLNNLMRSSYGRGILSVREDEIAASSMGINIRFYKTFSFVLGSAFAGLAGVLFAHDKMFLHPTSFTFMVSVTMLLMIVIGGLGSQLGAVIGAFIVTLLPELLRFAGPLSQNRMLVFSVLMIVMMLWKPDGLMGLVENFKARRRRLPS
jgi:branched-chain amino acid transport system permease protein